MKFTVTDRTIAIVCGSVLVFHGMNIVAHYSFELKYKNILIESAPAA